MPPKYSTCVNGKPSQVHFVCSAWTMQVKCHHKAQKRQSDNLGEEIKASSFFIVSSALQLFTQLAELHHI